MPAWVNPKTWATDDRITAAQLNTDLRDNPTHVRETHGPLWIPAVEFDGPAILTGGTDPNSLVTKSFADGATNYSRVARLVPDDWISGGFTIKVYWTTNVGTGVCRWVLNYKFVSAAGDVTAAGAELVVEPTAPGNNLLAISAFAATTAPTAGQLIRLNLRREGAHANDTMAAAALLIGVEAEYV